MSTLYELTEELKLLLFLAEDPETDEEALRGSMEAITGELEIKADGYAKVIRQLESDKAGIKAEKDRLDKRTKAIDNNIQRMKSALQGAMELADKPKFKTELFSFNIQNNPVSVVIDTEDVYSIPEDYLTYKAPEPNKTAIKDAIKNGKEFSFAHLEQSRSLRIR